MPADNLIRMYERSFREHRELPALTDYFKNETFSYYETAKEIAKLHMLLKKAGIRKGERIALAGRNNPRWAISYVAVITYGAVIVPIMQEFGGNDINHIINHCRARIVFLSESHWDLFDENGAKDVRAVFSLADFSCMWERYGSELSKFQKGILSHYRAAYPKGFTINDIRYDEIDGDSIAAINYTSGTTGFSKGVMLTLNNIAGNVAFALENRFHSRGSKALSLLPLAHTYGCSFDILAPLAAGSHITLLGRIPSGKVLVRAMQDVRPNLICTIPLILERLVRRLLVPMMENKAMKIASKLPGADNVIYAGMRKKLMSCFGGELSGVIIGGEQLNGEVAQLLRLVKFPFTVGYGMTECAPLISYSPPEAYKPGSCGKVIASMQVRIDSPDQRNIPGEIMVKGVHVMAGYYDDPKATSEAIDKDGWLHTGDIGTLDPDGTLYIKGRISSRLRNGTGQPVYPERIESGLNVLPCVMESLVVERQGRLTALVVPDYEQADAADIPTSGLKAVMNENLATLNSLTAPHEQIAEIVLYPEEFEKTPKRTIKRYIYT